MERSTFGDDLTYAMIAIAIVVVMVVALSLAIRVVIRLVPPLRRLWPSGDDEPASIAVPVTPLAIGVVTAVLALSVVGCVIAVFALGGSSASRSAYALWFAFAVLGLLAIVVAVTARRRAIEACLAVAAEGAASPEAWEAYWLLVSIGARNEAASVLSAIQMVALPQSAPPELPRRGLPWR